MAVFPRNSSSEDNYRMLVMLLVERLGGHVVITQEQVEELYATSKRLYIETAANEAVTLEVVPS